MVRLQRDERPMRLRSRRWMHAQSDAGEIGNAIDCGFGFGCASPSSCCCDIDRDYHCDCDCDCLVCDAEASEIGIETVIAICLGFVFSSCLYLDCGFDCDYDCRCVYARACEEESESERESETSCVVCLRWLVPSRWSCRLRRAAAKASLVRLVQHQQRWQHRASVRPSWGARLWRRGREEGCGVQPGDESEARRPVRRG